MPETRRSKEEGIKSWLQDRMEREVDLRRDDARRVTYFGIEGVQAELGVHEEALDRVGLEKVLKKLDPVPDMLRKDPTISLRLTGKGVVQDRGL